MFDAATIAAATGGEVLRDGPPGPVLTDTRGFSAGGWFLAIVGERFDGHQFLGAAQAAGAFGCIVSEPPGEEWGGGAVLVADAAVDVAACAPGAPAAAPPPPPATFGPARTCLPCGAGCSSLQWGRGTQRSCC